MLTGTLNNKTLRDPTIASKIISGLLKSDIDSNNVSTARVKMPTRSSSIEITNNYETLKTLKKAR